MIVKNSVVQSSFNNGGDKLKQYQTCYDNDLLTMEGLETFYVYFGYTLFQEQFYKKTILIFDSNLDAAGGNPSLKKTLSSQAYEYYPKIRRI